MLLVLKRCTLLLLFSLSACSHIKDLDAPCTEFGRYCHQEPINVVMMHDEAGV